MSCMSCHTFPGFEEISFKILIVISPFFNWPLASSLHKSDDNNVYVLLCLLFIHLHSRRPKWNGIFIFYIYIFAHLFWNK